MKKHARAAFSELKAMGCPVIDRQDSRQHFVISGEDNETDIWADYWYESPNFDFGVNPAVTEVLTKHGLYAEWENPGMLNVWDV